MSCYKCKYSKEIVNDYEWGHYHCLLHNRKRLGEMSCSNFKANKNNSHSTTTKDIEVHTPSNVSF